MRVLVCGGAGYIGSHMVEMLAGRGHEPIVFDDLSTGHADAVIRGTLVVGNVLDELALDRLFEGHGPFDLVMHFCARSLVAESVNDPALYWRNNVMGTLTLLDVMRRTGHDRIVFSSTAATYGMPRVDLIDEQQPCVPINPYGRTKRAVEQALSDYATAFGLRSVSLRYFNVAGAHPRGILGERHEPETHLIPRVLRSIGAGGQKVKVFGADYATRDGSCIRDYIHVWDLCEAHLLAGDYLDRYAGAHVFNLGNGQGFSVFEIIEAARVVTRHDIEYEIARPREGDPPALVANARRAIESLGWQPAYTGIEAIIESAWNFHRQNLARGQSGKQEPNWEEPGAI